MTAWKGLSLGWRIATVVAPVLLLAALWGWGWLAGRESCQHEHHVEMMRQAVAVSEHAATRAESQDAVEARHQEKRAAHAPKIRTVVKEVIKYVQADQTPCLLSPEYIDLVDRLTELQSGSESRVSETDAIADPSEELPAATASTTQLLLAFMELSRARLNDLGVIAEMQDSDAARYRDELRFWLGLPPQARGEPE